MEEKEVIEMCEGRLERINETDRQLVVKKWGNFLEFIAKAQFFQINPTVMQPISSKQTLPVCSPIMQAALTSMARKNAPH
jgi:hypothetical protein